jgi:nucleotide-binding universal stress UspA family protein
MFSNILVPLDGSAESNVALLVARTVARATGGAVTLLRIVQPGYPSASGHAAVELRRIQAELAESAPRVDSMVVESGHVGRAILDQVQRRSADLVIMRTHGRGGANRVLLGSVTQEVLSESRVPVLLLRPGGRRMTHLRKILVPTDGSPGGTLALATAVELARTTGASLKLLEVSQPASNWMYSGDAYGMSYYDPAWDEETLASARAYVDAVVARVRAANIDVDGEARQEPLVAGAIVAAADTATSDLIVMSTRALTGPARAILGSTADAVVRTAHCPVLLIHRNETPSEFEPEPATESTTVPV